MLIFWEFNFNFSKDNQSYVIGPADLLINSILIIFALILFINLRKYLIKDNILEINHINHIYKRALI